MKSLKSNYEKLQVSVRNRYEKTDGYYCIKTAVYSSLQHAIKTSLESLIKVFTTEFSQVMRKVLICRSIRVFEKDLISDLLGCVTSERRTYF